MRQKILKYGIPVFFISLGVILANQAFDLSGVVKLDSSKDLSIIVNKVRSHLVLPVDEDPLVATVSNADNLKISNSFYENADDGDFLILFESIQLGILYDPIEDILIKVVPLSLNTQISEPDQPQDQQVEVTVDIRNGTAIKGLASSVKDDLSDLESFLVVSTGNSYVNKRTSNIVVVLNPLVQESTYSQLLRELDASVMFSLPEGEIESEADVVLLLGETNN